jgi:hypothetical protein
MECWGVRDSRAVSIWKIQDAGAQVQSVSHAPESLYRAAPLSDRDLRPYDVKLRADDLRGYTAIET